MQATRGALPFTETYDFQADEATDVELAALPQHEVAERLLAARAGKDNGLVGIGCGFWGDCRLMSHRPQMAANGGGWTRTGSPDWLAELFPDLHDEPRPAASQSGAAP